MRVAAFATGFFSAYHYDSWTQIPGVELAGICVRPNRARSEKFKARYGAQATFEDPAEMLETVRPGLVDVITTPESHGELVKLAAERGIPVFAKSRSRRTTLPHAPSWRRPSAPALS